ncbi:MAG: NAD(P)/FAD-dependent oxidoreductase [Clostridia bacterium]|nr:NAD(P)/FAD-dependent oxidoreductase [Clostridia bacterium]
MEQVDFLVIGAGVVGLAITAELSERYGESSILLVEKHKKFGQETSSRNSEVIHSGIYYPTSSLKAQLCIEGNRLMYEFCRTWNIPHERIGKIIIARCEDEISALEAFIKKGMENGVMDLEMLDQKQVSRLEPNIKAVAAILSPSTGIVDSHQLMARFESNAKKQNAMIAYGHEVTGIEQTCDGYMVAYKSLNGDSGIIKCSYIINSAGLGSDKIAGLMGLDIDKEGYRLFPCKGEYFSVKASKSGMVSRLVYPPPLKNLKGLGIHVTKSMDGNIRLGPNAFYVDQIDYDVDSGHSGMFYKAAKEYLPFLEELDIGPDMAGVRPKLQGPDDPVKDFIINYEGDKGLPGVINLLGIESPGLTSSLSIAKYVVKLIENKF